MTGQRSAFAASLIVGFGRVVSTGALAAAAVLAARELAPAGRGALAVLVTISSLTAVLLASGIALAGRSLLVESDRPIALRDYLGLTGTASAVSALLLVIAAVSVIPLAGVHPDKAGVAALALHGAAGAAGVLTLNALYAYGAFASAVAAEVVGSASALAGTGALVITGNGGAADYVLPLAAGLALQTVVALWALRRHGLGVGVDQSSWKRLLRRGAAGTGVGLAQAATYRFDRYLVGLFTTTAQTGLYSAAATGAELLRLVPTAAGQVILHRTAVGSRVTREARALRRHAIWATVLLAILFAAAARPLLLAVLGEAYVPARAALVLLLVAELATASFLIDSSMLTGLGAVGTASRAAIIGFAVVTALDVVLIPWLGIEGAAIASIVGYASMAAAARRSLSTRRGSPRPPAGDVGGSPAG